MNSKWLLRLSLSINAILIFVFAAKRMYYHRPPTQPSLSYWDSVNEDRLEKFKEMPIGTDDIVLVGNSLAEQFPVDLLKYCKVKNRGISGNRSRHIVQRISDLARAHPKYIFLEFGINDIYAGISLDTLMENYKTTIREIEMQSPQTRIVVQSIFPTSKDFGQEMPAVVSFNARLKDFCLNKAIPFIDLFSSLVAGNQLDERYTADGLHLNIYGQKIWAQKIDSVLVCP